MMGRSALALAVLALLLATACAQRPSASGSTDTKPMTQEQRDALAVVLPVLFACKSFTYNLCLRHDANREPGPPPPAIAALCLHDNEAQLTGDCSEQWTALPRGPVNTVLSMGLDVITPRAQFKRACDADVTAHCSAVDVHTDVLVCLEGASGVSVECQTELATIRAAQEKARQGDGSVEGSGTVHGSVPPGMTVGDFQGLSSLEIQRTRNSVGNDDSGGVSVQVIALVAVGVALVLAIVALAAWLVALSRAEHRRVLGHNAAAAVVVTTPASGEASLDPPAASGGCGAGADKSAGLVAKLERSAGGAKGASGGGSAADAGQGPKAGCNV